MAHVTKGLPLRAGDVFRPLDAQWWEGFLTLDAERNAAGPTTPPRVSVNSVRYTDVCEASGRPLPTIPLLPHV